MKRDIDYVVKDGQVIIVDEFTGRLMFGRRYNEGLHQAIAPAQVVPWHDRSQSVPQSPAVYRRHSYTPRRAGLRGPGAATNMAGRGTDIMLGGNAEFLAKADLRKSGMSSRHPCASVLPCGPEWRWQPWIEAYFEWSSANINLILVLPVCIVDFLNRLLNQRLHQISPVSHSKYWLPGQKAFFRLG